MAFLNGLTAQQKGTKARWDSNKKSMYFNERIKFTVFLL